MAFTGNCGSEDCNRSLITGIEYYSESKEKLKTQKGMV